jgi:CubicO group peptidase (beta-lactamase class C family)
MSRVVLLAIAALSGVSSTGCIFSRMFYYATPNLNSPDYFDSREVSASPTPKPWKREPEAAFALNEVEAKSYSNFEDLLASNKTKGFLVLKDDRIIYERYFDDVTEKTILPAFSISKTLGALLVGCAVQDGLFSSADDKLVSFIPELAKKDGYGDITLDHLLRMTSGIDFQEESVAGAMFYYSWDLRSRMYLYDVKWRPGTHYLYGSINTQLLWDALHRRIGGRTVAKYFEERVWAPLGAESGATWSLDSKQGGIEKLFGGFNATLRDHARVGALFLHGGVFDGKQLVSSEWVKESLTPDPVPGIIDSSDGWVRRAKYQWFITLDGRAYFAKGYHGQYIFLVPSKNMVFMRFGEGYANVDWPALFLRIAEAS